MTHGVHVFLSARSVVLQPDAFAAVHGLTLDHRWHEIQRKPWGNVGTHSGFTLTVFRGMANELKATFLAAYLAHHEHWLRALAAMPSTLDLSVDFKLDTCSSQSPSLDIPTSLMSKLVTLRISLVATASCAERDLV
jgi:hypothetical protein